MIRIIIAIVTVIIIAFVAYCIKYRNKFQLIFAFGKNGRTRVLEQFDEQKTIALYKHKLQEYFLTEGHELC